MVLIFIFPYDYRDVEHIFMYLLAMCMSFFEKTFKFFARLLIGFCFYYWVKWVPYIFWILAPYQDKWFANVFSHSIDYLFIFLIVSFAVQKTFSLIQFYFFNFAFVACAHGVLPKNCSWEHHQEISPSVLSFTASSLPFRSFNSFELISVSGVS